MNVLDEKRSSPELRGYVKERIRKMQDVMARKGVDVTILMRPENVFYFSNFNPILISHVPYFILTRDDAFLLVHCIRHDHAVNEGAVDKVLCYGKWAPPRPWPWTPWTPCGSFWAAAPSPWAWRATTPA